MASDGHPQSAIPAKRRRITRACDRCHRASLKCAPGPTSQSCQPCASHEVECTFDRPFKRRGPPARPRSQNTTTQLLQHQSPTYGLIAGTHTSWEYSHVADAPVIEYLVENYHQIVYPILLYFHWPSFSADVLAKRYMFDRSFFALTMAVCATASTRLSEGLPAHLASQHINMEPNSSVSGVFYTACLDSLPTLNTDEVKFNFMRTEALLGMLCLEYNNIRGCHAHLHRYLAMCAENGFNNENRWPSNLTEIEIQERRRLFWQQYHFDVYLATIFGSSVCQRGQTQCNVLYPAEVYDDNDISESAVHIRGEEHVSFIRGWNFVTDLYRILEQIIEKARSRSSSQFRPSGPMGLLFSNDTIQEDWSVSNVLSTSQQMYNDLPVELREAHPTTGDRHRDRYGFQAINAMITLTTVKMVLAQTENHSVSQLCKLAGGFLDELSAIPTTYMRSTSTAMVHHLAGVGHILGHVITAPLSQWTYIQVRSALLAMADLVSSLEIVIRSAKGISSKLRGHVERIDEYMVEAAKKGRQNQIIHSAMPRTTYPTSSQELRLGNSDTQALDTIRCETERHGQSSSDANIQLDEVSNDPFNIPLDEECQFQLPDELFSEWSFDFGHSDAFTFLGQDIT